ncbi:LamG-like jellyroll fold domain-containing protein [Parabacteroides sp. Marseille-P3160]|uniref:LamG-like jellyroll fold domain-containing protein n=1 Tax=Parabacteroides sp. Marseille-P3160 TaxID=1917887 RepID=UPI0009BA5E70|nr:LamG-like jellyroll fold domain-containing protein [Parabacteroides sp. Marseille-P3160]
MSGYLRAPGGGGLTINKEEVSITPTIDVTKGDIVYLKNGTYSKLYLDNYERQYLIKKSATANTQTTAYLILTADISTKFLFHAENNIADDSESNLYGTITGSVNYSAGKFGQGVSAGSSSSSIDFDSIGSVLNLPSWSEFAVEWWEKRSSTADSGGVVSIAANKSSTFSRYVFGQSYSGTLYFVINETTISMGTIEANDWRHLRVTKSGNTYKTWKNGVLVATTTSSAAFTPVVMWLLNTTKNASAFTGLVIDELRISDVVRDTDNFAPPSGPFGRYN